MRFVPMTWIALSLLFAVVGKVVSPYAATLCIWYNGVPLTAAVFIVAGLVVFEMVLFCCVLLEMRLASGAVLALSIVGVSMKLTAGAGVPECGCYGALLGRSEVLWWIMTLGNGVSACAMLLGSPTWIPTRRGMWFMGVGAVLAVLAGCSSVVLRISAAKWSGHHVAAVSGDAGCDLCEGLYEELRRYFGSDIGVYEGPTRVWLRVGWFDWRVV